VVIRYAQNMPNVINKVTLNGNAGGYSVAQDWICALNDERIVREKAGFLFKASLCEDHWMLAVAPCLINGERSYHYNMLLEQENQFTLIGSVDAQGAFTILFKPESRESVERSAAVYIGVFRQFAKFLGDTGYTGRGALDEVTQRVLKQLGISPVPESIFSL
jgi:hypothetical protein